MKRTHKKYSQRQMFTFVKKWQKSGKSKKQFCKEHEIAKSTFYKWIKEYQELDSEKHHGFAPVTIKEAPLVSSEKIEIHFPNGVYLSITDNITPAMLKSFVTIF